MLAELERRPARLRLAVGPGLTIQLGYAGGKCFRVVLSPESAKALAHHLLVAADSAFIAGEDIKLELDALTADRGDHA